MQDTIPGFVVFIGALVLAALIISVGFYVYNNQKEASDAVLAQTNAMTTQLQESQWTQYEGSTVTGSEVFAVIKRMKDLDTFVSVDGKYYIYTDNTLTTPQTQAEWDAALKAAKKRGSESYIVPSKKYYGKVVRDENTTAILGIAFTSEETE